MEGDTMSVPEAAKALKVSRATIYRMIEDQRLRAYELPHLKKGRVRVDIASVQAFQRQIAELGQPR